MYAPQLLLIAAASVARCRNCNSSVALVSLQNAALLGVDHAGIFMDSPSKDLTDARNRETGEELSLDDDSTTRLIKLECDAEMFALLTGAF